MRVRTDYRWVAVFATLVTLAVPWFLWGDSRVFAGLPLWFWWYIGWMGLTAVVFHPFTRTAWDCGITGEGR